jgi:hypothetical protein
MQMLRLAMQARIVRNPDCFILTALRPDWSANDQAIGKLESKFHSQPIQQSAHSPLSDKSLHKENKACRCRDKRLAVGGTSVAIHQPKGREGLSQHAGRNVGISSW